MATATNSARLLLAPVCGSLSDVVLAGLAAVVVVTGALAVFVLDGVVVEVEDVAVTLGPELVVDELCDVLEVEVFLVSLFIATVLESDLSVSFPYAQRVPVKMPNSSPPTTIMPSTVISTAVGLLTESAALI